MFRTTIVRSCRGAGAAGSALFLAVAVAACAPMYSPPQQVEARAPQVSYTYSTDADLVDANQRARTYCNEYYSMPSMESAIYDNPDGSGTKTVTFTCVKTAAAVSPPATVPPSSPPTQYSYRTDTELLQAIRSADAYCMRAGQVASTNVVTNADGTKSLSYQCVPR